LYKTYSDDCGMEYEDFVYIPIVLKKGENKVKLDLGRYKATIREVSLVTVESRWN